MTPEEKAMEAMVLDPVKKELDVTLLRLVRACCFNL